jgi:hypothetical protein
MRIAIGVTMIVAIFFAIALLSARLVGWVQTLAIFAVAAGLIAWIYAAAVLIKWNG